MGGSICMPAFCTPTTITTKSRRCSRPSDVRSTRPHGSTRGWATPCLARRARYDVPTFERSNVEGAHVVRIVLDAAGGDHAPEQPVRGAVLAARELGCEIVLV